ncbi:EF-hand domain pair [Phytophthora cactorum]|nr:EF-hand domain pair [Phytophthora cactorum]
MRIRAAFDMFDKDKKGCVIQEEVSTIMRYLGAYPTEKDIIKKILPEVCKQSCNLHARDEPSTFVTYDRFEKKMLEVLYTNEYEPDTDETLLAAFRVRDEVAIKLPLKYFRVHSRYRASR